MKKYTVHFNSGNQHDYPSIVVNVVGGMATPEDARRVQGILDSTRSSSVLQQRNQLLAALEDSLRLIEMLMPGVRHLAIQDYAFLNDVPIRARAAIAAAKGNDQ